VAAIFARDARRVPPAFLPHHDALLAVGGQYYVDDPLQQLTRSNRVRLPLCGKQGEANHAAVHRSRRLAVASLFIAAAQGASPGVGNYIVVLKANAVATGASWTRSRENEGLTL
jgi:hypothetical protein